MFKTLVGISLALSLLVTERAQAQFGNGSQIYSFGGSAKIAGADLDGDGDQDLFGVFNGHHLKWFENLDGAGDMDQAAAIATLGGTVRSYVLADSDNDGDIDILLVRSGHDGVFLLRNEGSGTFEDLELIVTTPQQPEAISVNDINGDGVADLLMTIGTFSNSGFGWCPGVTGGFGALIEVVGIHVGGASPLLVVGDIDLIGGVDLVLQAQENALVLVRNTAGNATEWDVESLPISADPPSYPYWTPVLLDVDGDGDLDLAESKGPSVHWLRNNLDEGGVLDFSENLIEPWTTGGTGVFGPSPCGGAGVVYVPSDPNLPVRWNTYVDAIEGFPYSADLPAIPRGEDLRFADLNGDGHLDLIISLPNGVRWYPNSAVPSTEVLTLPVLDTLCLSGASVQLPEATPSGGRWYGQQVFGSVLMRGNILEPTELPLAHVVHTMDGCPLADASTLRLIDRPTILSAIPDVLCSADDPIDLLADPVDVQWYGTDGSDILDPALFNGGFVVCEYTDATGAVCGNLRGPILKWNTLPATIAPAGPFCTNDPVQVIEASAIPPFGGTWSGDVAGSTTMEATFDPSQGPGEYEVILEVQPFGQGQCGNSDTLLITVGERPEITFTPFQAYCAEGGPITLTGVSPADGVWSGPGVTKGVLDPIVPGAGTHLLSYFATSPEGCARQSATSITLADTIALEWDAPDLELCPLDSPVTFTASPSEGVWSSPVDGNGVCDPGMLGTGIFPLEYTYTDPQGCVLTNEAIDITVGPISEVSMDPIGTLCSTDAPVQINGSENGTWSGSVSGEGTSILFDPGELGPGIWSVTFTATTGNDCSGSTTQEIIVDVCSGIVDRTTLGASLAPNPFRERTWITLNGEAYAAIEVLDAAGRSVLSDQFTGSGKHLIDLGGQEAGCYLIRVLQGSDQTVFRALKMDL